MPTYEQRLREITGGRAPEEGDFNTARLTASDTPLSVRRAIQAELEAVECGGVSTQEEFEDEEDYRDDQRDEPETDRIFAECACGWWNWEEYYKGSSNELNELEEAKKQLFAEHQSRNPDCKLEPIFQT